jgi:predicted glycosyltransferase
MPFASDIYVPSCFYSNPRFSVTRYNSYYPLAYTHPDWFQPSPAVFDHIPIDREEPFAILRLVSWNAAHDVGQNGIKDVKYLISKLEESGIRVLISSEGALPSSLKSYQMSIPPHTLHHL